VNDNQTSTNVSFDFTSWAINDSTWIPVETVSSNYWVNLNFKRLKFLKYFILKIIVSIKKG
jgi:hypothetical protein